MKKNKTIMLFVLAFLLIFSTSGINNVEFTARAATTKSVTINYYRYDNNYTNWNIWLWAYGSEGKDVQFTQDSDFGKKAVVNVSNVTANEGVGFIIKKGSWVDREPGGDRFIPLSAFVDDKAEIFIVQSDTDIYYNANEADKTPKVLNAVFTDSKVIDVKVTNALTDANKDSFTVKEDGASTNLSISSTTAKAGATSFKITLSAAVSFDKVYKIEATDYKGRYIAMDSVYETDAFNSVFQYDGELGAIYTAVKTDFKLWAPSASGVKLNLYSAGSGDNLIKTVAMTKGGKGVWTHSENGDLDKKYYTYSVTNLGLEYEVVDPYARTAGVNGKRGMIINLASTNPQGWESQPRPVTNYTDAVIYEAHIRDLTIDPSSGVTPANRGKFLGMTEKGTKNSSGLSTALDHLIELGITELHVLPMYDYYTVDESKPEVAQFNWGYDPLNYNVPEGSYSSDATKGEVRVNELKQMIMTLHNNGIRIVMDVVYNHTSKSADSDFEKIMPGYYYRKDANGSFSNGSGCGNETASERAMYRKFMIDSVKHWATEYKIDGFRFDLMGLHDTITMNMIRSELNGVNPNIMIYGEGWTGGTSTLPDSKKATLANIKKVPGIGMFNDVQRNAIKGGVGDLTSIGYIQGGNGYVENIKQGIVGGGAHSQVNSSTGWKTGSPSQCINYASAHDNYTLWDKLQGTTKTESVENRTKMNNLAAAIVLTSQGVPFFQAGEELLRTKPDGEGGYDENSYKSSDAVNSIKWDTKTDNVEVFNYYKGLIALRKAYKQFQMNDTFDVEENLQFIEGLPANVIGFSITGKDANNKNQKIYVIHNSTKEDKEVNVEKGDYGIYVQGGVSASSALSEFNGNSVEVKAISTTVIIEKMSETTKGGCGSKNSIAGLGVALAFIAVSLLKNKIS